MNPALRDGRRRARPGVRTVTGLVALVLGLGVAARLVRYLLNFPLWGDEAFLAVDFLIRDYAGLVEPLTYRQIVPLGYAWAVLTSARLAGPSEYALRAVALGAGLVVLPLFWCFCRWHLGRRASLLAVAFLAASYYVIRHSAEVKPYASDLLVALALLVLGWRTYVRPERVGRWAALVLGAALAPWCSYPSVFVLGAVGLLLTLRLVRSPAAALVAGWAAFGVVACGSFVGMYVVYGRPHFAAASAAGIEEIGMWRKTFPPLTDPLRLPLWFLDAHAGLMLAYPNGAKYGGSGLTLLLVVAGSVALWRTRRRDLLLLLLSPLALNFVAAALHRYPYGGTVRTSIFMAPAFCLLAGVGTFALLARLLPRRNYGAGESFVHGARANVRAVGALLLGRGPLAERRARFRALRHRPILRDGLYVAVGVLALFALGSIAADLVQPYKKGANERARDAIRWLAQRSSPQDRWITFNATQQVPYAPYIAPWKGDGAQFIFYVMRHAPVPDARRRELHFWQREVFAPPPDALRPPDAGAKTWLLWYHGANFRAGYSPEQFDAYLRAAVEALGNPTRHVFVLQVKRDVVWQQLDVYEFPAR